MRNTVKIERVTLELTQQQLADELEVSRQTINSLETQRYIPYTTLALKIARYFKKPVEELFKLEDGD